MGQGEKNLTSKLFLGVACAIGLSAAGCASAPRAFPVDKLSHFIGMDYQAVKAKLGSPDNEIRHKGGVMAIWYIAWAGAAATVQNKNCQISFIVDSTQTVTSADMTGDPGVCDHAVSWRGSKFRNQ